MTIDEENIIIRINLKEAEMGKYAGSILDIINKSQEHLTAEQVFFRLKKAYPNVVLATVYNNLNALCREGKIRRVSAEGSPDRYDRVQKHDHLICSRCGKLSDVSFADLTGELEKQLGDSIISYDLKVLYICPDCRGGKQ